jgi:hypothetical protein
VAPMSKKTARGEAERIAAKKAKRLSAVAEVLRSAGVVTEPLKDKPVHPPPKSRPREEPPMSPQLRSEREQRTKTKTLASVWETLRTMSREELGGADPVEVFERVKQILQEVEIERYSDERLAKSQGLPRSWLGNVWEAMVASFPWLREHLAAHAGEEIHDLNREFADGGAVRFNPAKREANGVNPVERIADLDEKTRPPSFTGPVEVLLDVRLLPNGTSPDNRNAAKKYTDVMHVSFQSASEKTPAPTREYYEGCWVGKGIGTEIKVEVQADKIKVQQSGFVARLEDSSHLIGVVADPKTWKPVLDAAGNPIEVMIPVDRLILNANSTTNRFGITGTSETPQIPPGQKIDLDVIGHDIQLGEKHGQKVAVIMYTLPIPIAAADKITGAIFGRTGIFKRKK